MTSEKHIPIPLSEIEQRQLNALAADMLDLAAEELGLVQGSLFYLPDEDAISIEFDFPEGISLDDRHRAAILKLLGTTKNAD